MSTTQQMMDRINQSHAWEYGQDRSTGGTGLTSDDTCRICGLMRTWYSERRENDQPERHVWHTSDGDEIALVAAARMSCGGDQ